MSPAGTQILVLANRQIYQVGKWSYQLLNATGATVATGNLQDILGHLGREGRYREAVEAYERSWAHVSSEPGEASWEPLLVARADREADAQIEAER